MSLETGTFLLAPGFSISFGGSFETLNGVIAASAVEFFGNAGGTINGSVINYGQSPMTLTGSVDLAIDRSGGQEIPAGFELEVVLSFLHTNHTITSNTAAKNRLLRLQRYQHHFQRKHFTYLFQRRLCA